MSYNALPELVPAVTQLRKLKTLKLSHNTIPTVPASLGTLTDLTVLDLSFNQIEVVPRTIRNLTNLTELKINGNSSMESPPFEVVSEGLEAIFRYMNEIEEGNLTNRLNIGSFKLEYVPDEVWAMTNLMC